MGREESSRKKYSDINVSLDNTLAADINGGEDRARRGRKRTCTAEKGGLLVGEGDP